MTKYFLGVKNIPMEGTVRVCRNLDLDLSTILCLKRVDLTVNYSCKHYYLDLHNITTKFQKHDSDFK